MPELSREEINTEFPRASFLGKPAKHLVAGWLHWVCLILEGAEIHPPWKRHIFEYTCAFSSHTASARTIICGLTEGFSYHFGIPSNINSDQGTFFTPKKVQKWNHTHGINCSCHTSYHLQMAGLIRRWNNLLSAQLLHQLWVNILKGLGSVLQDTVCALNQRPLILVMKNRNNKGIEKIIIIKG